MSDPAAEDAKLLPDIGQSDEAANAEPSIADAPVLSGRQAVIARILLPLLRPVFLRDPKYDPDGAFSNTIRENETFKTLCQHGVDPQLLHNICMRFAQHAAVRQHTEKSRRLCAELLKAQRLVHAAADTVPSSPKVKAGLQAHGRYLGAMADRLKAPAGRPTSTVLQLYCGVTRTLVAARSDGRRFYNEFRQLAQLIFNKEITDEAYDRMVRRVNRDLRSESETLSVFRGEKEVVREVRIPEDLPPLATGGLNPVCAPAES